MLSGEYARRKVGNSSANSSLSTEDTYCDDMTAGLLVLYCPCFTAVSPSQQDCPFLNASLLLLLSGMVGCSKVALWELAWYKKLGSGRIGVSLSVF